MNLQKSKNSRFARLTRALKLNFLKLLRAPGGAHKVSTGFALGFGLELIVISTASLVYLVFYPIVRLSGGSLPAAIVGNVVGKLTFLPIILMPLAKQIGSWILPAHSMGQGPVHESAFMELFRGNWSALSELLLGGLDILAGMSVFGVILGVISYFVVKFFYVRALKRRFERRLEKRKQAAMSPTPASVLIRKTSQS
ncbi:DUF2062 domain-containing protein [Paenibacillus sp. UMB7766-LJ446]|jgi:uncharacterized protein (DUF2062 family)|uniref:DUF2062 domain-containing protein n=1 Tax=Paenibacillus TaxID=44249 RepID=UPI00041AB481|nr:MULTISPECIES: DUF2062 domain-containing protein [Paenibacillus]OPG99664.1 group-specific protein [Chryseobacterium mucoviscidosis]KGP80166.1 group-specific protein [Paenibacillus sp. MAEPY2]KGP86389.1 group-specific protein [Paenibacillus sp. MAEPY1]MDK8190682.1 DUF2062 domain-containing protein [Paenibacillus sp. UMB7766-LJ446]MDN8589462.1 DUF2062 domain-containing protein [Paenibacillus sp. 11B]